MSNKTPKESSATRETPGQDPRGGGRGRGKPFPRGVEESIWTLNHLSPEGWWDLMVDLKKSRNDTWAWTSKILLFFDRDFHHQRIA